MAVKKDKRKAREDVRNERKTALAARQARIEKAAAYDVKYKADAQARRDKLAAEAATAAPAAPPAPEPPKA